MENKILKLIESADDSELVQLFNTACEVLNYSDDIIYSFDEDFFTTFFNENPMEAARATLFGDINWSDDWIRFNGYGNLESISDVKRDIDTNIIIEAFNSDASAFE